MREKGDLPVFMLALDGEDAVQPRGRGPRTADPRWRLLAAALALTTMIVLVVVNREEPPGIAQPVPPQPTPTAAASSPSSLAPSATQSWKLTTLALGPDGQVLQTADTCGTRAPLPQITAASLDEPTGVRLVIGAAGVIDVDSQSLTRNPIALNDSDRIVQLLTHGGDTFLMVGTCTLSEPVRILKVGADGSTDEIPVELFGQQTLGSLIVVDEKVWVSVFSQTFNRGEFAMIPLDGGAQVPIPRNFWAFAGVGRLVVGRTDRLGYEVPDQVQLFDLEKQEVVETFEHVASVAIGSEAVFWISSTCAATCPLNIYNSVTGKSSVADFTVPADFDLNGAAVSSDGSKVAAVNDSRTVDFARDGSITRTGAHVDVLDIRDGEIDSVPGVELFDKYTGFPRLLFSADNTWLVIGVPAKTGTDVLLWRPGMTESARALSTSDSSYYPAPIAVDSGT